jgi:hypothetical protein
MGRSLTHDRYSSRKEFHRMNAVPRYASLLLLLGSAALVAQQPGPLPTTAAQAPNRDTSYIDARGTAHVTRVVPVPTTISPQAQEELSRAEPDQGPPEPLALRRSRTDAWAAGADVAWSKICPNQLVEDKMAGVPVRIVTPEGMPEGNRDKVLLDLHGGGFDSDSGSYTESIPIAGFTQIKVVAALYRLAPEHPFPAAVDDAVAVYKELLKTYKPEHIAIYGTSAGAILTGEVAVKIKQLGLPEPAALGIFSGLGDFARNDDSRALYGLRASGPAHSRPPRLPVCDHNRSQGSGALAHLRRPARNAADAVHHQRPRPAAERHGEPAPGFSACGRGCAAGGLRRADSCLLV